MKAGDIVECVESGNRYRIIFDATRGVMRVCWKWVPAYTYRRECEHNGPVFTTDQIEFERGFRIAK